mgnify:CR=1 FL=1
MNYSPQTTISDAVILLEATYEQLIKVFDPEVYNPLCLCGAATCEGVVEEVLTRYSPELFTDAETALVINVHNFVGEIIDQYDDMKEIE